MAACESCGKNGFNRSDMDVDVVRRIIVGPCCKQNVLAAPATDLGDLEYGVNISSKTGVTAYFNGGGFNLQFNKSPNEIKKFVEEFRNS
jgi:hypothetical protein